MAMPPPNEERLNHAMHVQCKTEMDVTIAELPLRGCKDPCDFIMKYGGEAFRKIAEGGENVIDYKFRKLQTELTGGPNACARGVREVISFFGKYMFYRVDIDPDDPAFLTTVRRGQIVRRLAALSGLAIEETRQILDHAMGLEKLTYERRITRIKEESRKNFGQEARTLVNPHIADPKRAAALDILDAIARDEEEWDPPQPPS